jgi:peptidoglycan/LPS O-acetylase OafA/YrhL
MPEPVGRSQRYLPGLDGLRALAVLAVIAYHLNLGWAPGGLLGVGVFFTLSGYLITDLLLNAWHRTGRLPLRDFWLRRARRLLPALFVMMGVVTAWITVADRAQLVHLRAAVLAAAGYVSNWWLIATHSSYFARFGPPQPFGHLWSLAVEEQFYLVWPWLLWLGLAVTRPARGGAEPARQRTGLRRVLPRGLPALAAATLALAAASAAEMALLYQPGQDPTRIYDGTDTRASALLVGAALAMVWPSHRPAPSARQRRWLDVAGFAGLAVIAVLIWRTSEYSAFLYRYGLNLLSLATAAVVAAVATPGTRMSRWLGREPLRWLGVRSYGIYLWHFPVIVLTSPASGSDPLPLAAAQVAASIILAALSWRFVEEPVRRGALGRAWARARSVGFRPAALARAGWVAVFATVAVLALAAAGLSGAVRPLRSGLRTAASYSLSGSVTAAGGPAAAAAGPGHPAIRARPGSGPLTGSLGFPEREVWESGLYSRLGWAAAGAPASPASQGPQTSCRAVAHIGDSTSDGLVSPLYLPRRERIQAQYARVGVTSWHFEISGARSIVEGLPGQLNGQQVAENLIRHGYHGCWVIALGTNDTADVVVGSPVSRAERIALMMKIIGNQPVMWVNVVSLLSSGPYAETYMRLWNQALVRACARYPNMRVFDWAALAKPRWFIADGIHYTSAGYAARARLIADALARAFPAHGKSAGCVVR